MPMVQTFWRGINILIFVVVKCNAQVYFRYVQMCKDSNDEFMIINSQGPGKKNPTIFESFINIVNK